MNLFPVARRELQVVARRPATYRARLTIALLAILFAAWNLLTLSFSASPANQGSILFWVMARGALLLCLAAGPLLTTGAIGEEKRDGTLGFLFLTDLKPIDIVTGKLAAVGLNALVALLAVFPIMSTAWLMGGVTGGEVVRVNFHLLSTLLLSLTIGLWASSGMKSHAHAVIQCVIVLTLLAVGPSLFSSMVTQFPRLSFQFSQWIPEPLTLSSCDDLHFRSRKSFFWISIFSASTLTSIFLVWTTLRLSRHWRKDEVPLPWSGRMARLTDAGTEIWANQSPATLNRAWLDKNPILAATAPSSASQVWIWVATAFAFFGRKRPSSVKCQLLIELSCRH